MGGTKILPLVLIFGLLIVPIMASAKNLYYQDENIGLVTVDVKTTLVERMLNLLQTQTLSITTSEKSILVGEELNVKVITEVPCEDRSGKILKDSDISVAKFVITDPALSTTNFDIKTGGVIGDLEVCQTNQFDLTFVPKKEGKYVVHYVVMQKVYPQILVKEVNEFTVVKAISAPTAPSAPPTLKEEAPMLEEVPKDIPPEPENELFASGCTEDLIQLCADSSKIVAYTCSQGVLVPTQEQCKEGNEGAQGEISTIDLLFNPEFYGIYTYIVIALAMVITVVVITRGGKK